MDNPLFNFDETTIYPEAWFSSDSINFSKLNTKKNKTCFNCKELINIGQTCIEFKEEKNNYTNIKEKIICNKILLKSWYMCEDCGELFLLLKNAKIEGITEG